MSKLTHKCPNCGATMPVDVKYCRKCHAKMDSGRVEVLSRPEKEQQHPQKGNKKDALRNLPKPVRPVEEEQPVETAPAEAGPAAAQDESGYFSAEQQEKAVAAAMTGAVVRRERRASAGDDTPRPVSTARGAGAQAAPDRNREKNLWQIITVLAIIFVIIVVAILLVIKLNQPASGNAQSDPYEGANVITGDVGGPPAVPDAESTDPAGAPEGLVVPTATPSVTPTAVPTPTATPIPAATATPIPSATPTANTTNANYTVTPTNDTVYINGNGVNIRSGPGTDYQAIGSENTGKQLQRTGKTSNGWSQVAYNGQTAYVIDSLLTTTQPASSGGSSTTTSGVTSASGTVKVTSSIGANLRSGPGTGYSIVTAVPVNTELTRTGTSGDWTLVSYNGQNLYISSSLITDSSAGTTTATATTAPTTNSVTAASGTVTVTGNDVNIRTGPGTSYSRIGSVNSGTVLTVTGTSGNWYQVTYNGQTAYIIGDYVKKN